MRKRYEVQMNTLCDGWTNVWSEDDKPMTFGSRKAAQAEIDEFLSDVADAVRRGDMSDSYDPDDFRIVELEK